MTDSPQPKRLIEVAFPLREVSAESREKRQISGIHMWWARRPPTACRAAIFAALVPDPDDVDCPPVFRSLVEELLRDPHWEKEDSKSPHPRLRRRLLGFIADLCRWENSDNERLLGIARRLIREASGGVPPKVMDPFAGGGAIPLEALRLGCDTRASDLNPVAVLILKCTVEYPQKYGQPDSRPVPDYIHEMDRREAEAKGQRPLTDGDGAWAASYRRNPLVTDVQYWGEWVLSGARERLADYYPPSRDETSVVAYLWARVVKCPNPACGAEMPLFGEHRLGGRNGPKFFLVPVLDNEARTVTFRVEPDSDKENDAPIGPTTETGGSARCIFCGGLASQKYLQEESIAGRIGEQIAAVVTSDGRGKGKGYRSSDENDRQGFELATAELRGMADASSADLPPVPHEPIATNNSRYLTPGTYGLDTWGKLFNARQLLALVTMVELVREAHETMLTAGLEADYTKAVTTYLAFVSDRVADYGSTLCTWHRQNEQIRQTFNRQALQLPWDYAESNPVFGASGSFESALRALLRTLKILPVSGCSPAVEQADVAEIEHGQTYDCLITDPPYYDQVPYADLSDFFYVWLKRSVGDLHASLFARPLTPKKEELVQDPLRHRGDGGAAKLFFEDGMYRTWVSLKSALADGAVGVIVFAHKSTEAWETLISALIRAGWKATASWPLSTEMGSRLRARESAALEYSVFVACRPLSPDADVAYLHEVSEELRSRIRERLDYFWAQGIRGADFFVSAIGPALEVYSRHAEVRTTAGDRVTVKQFLELVRSEVIDYALAQVLGNGSLGAVDNETRFYVLWRWAYGAAPLEAGEVITFVKPMGVELDEIIRDGIVRKKGSKITLKSATDRADDEDLGLPRAGIPAPIIDGIHRCLNLWRLNKRQELADYLSTLGDTRVEVLKRCAQALSEVLREDDPERRDIHAMLTGGLEPSMRRML